MYSFALEKGNYGVPMPVCPLICLRGQVCMLNTLSWHFLGKVKVNICASLYTTIKFLGPITQVWNRRGC